MTIEVTKENKQMLIVALELYMAARKDYILYLVKERETIKGYRKEAINIDRSIHENRVAAEKAERLCEKIRES